ncbi:MAG TPA: hypothetical protein VI911_12085 [Patescibacteria group bacterium]|nr:hypothetical protein [Patescibacteria group bacterium]
MSNESYLFRVGMKKMKEGEYFSEIVISNEIFEKLICESNNQRTYRNRGFKDIIGESYFLETEVGQIYKTEVVRVWNEDKLLEYMKTGRKVCS